MAFDTVKKEYSKQHFWYVEIDIGLTTYRFCENVSPLPSGFAGVPSLNSIRTSPAEIDLSGGIGVRAKMSAVIEEHMDYTVYGTATAPVRFWARWRAENPYYLGQSIRAYSGYIVEGAFDVTNFQQRSYIIESFSQTGKGVAITGKDVLKLASNERSQAPVESKGLLSADITDVAVSATLIPVGIGDAEYPASGFIRIGDEIVAFTRVADVLTLTRGQFNTLPAAQSQDDVCQLCLRYDAETVADINYDLLVTYAGVSPSFINKVAWDAESSNAYTTTYSTLITEPTGVRDLIKELGESAPNYLYWDERFDLIQFTALKAPPETATTLRYDSSILENSFSVKDMQEMRISTVVTNFGQFDPTKPLDEFSNYRQTYVREDSDSVANYGQRIIKTVYSRWISNDNKTAAVLMAARIGRRFASAPRSISFQVDAKDSDVWTGDDIRVVSDIIEQAGGGFADLPYQVISVQEQQNYSYSALEHTYGPPVDGDEDAEDPNVRLIFINGDIDQIKDEFGVARTLRDLYDDVYPGDFDPAYDIRFIFEVSCVSGSSLQASPAINTGSFAGLTLPPLIDNRGLIVGKGGDGSDVGGSAQAGGAAIEMQHDIRLDNSGTVGGGGGGGGYANDSALGNSVASAGGGGGGYFNGLRGTGTVIVGTPSSGSPAQPGTNTEGGDGAQTRVFGAEPIFANGGNGGDLGSPGLSGSGSAGAGSSGGAAGAAINQNGNTITYVNAGTILGAVNA